MTKKQMIELETLVKEYKKYRDDKIKGNLIFNKIYKILKLYVGGKSNKIAIRLQDFQIEQDDIQQDLYLKILNLIDDYDINIPFENYFNRALKRWMPKLSEEDIISLDSLEEEINEEGESLKDRITSKSLNILNEKEDRNIPLEEIFAQCEDDNERRICELYLENPGITEQEIAEKLGTYQRNISRIINKLRKRLKNIV